MLTACVLVLASSGFQEPTPGALVSRMLARYHEAQSVVGKIVFTQSASGHTIKAETALQIQRPSKLYIHQALGGSEPKEALVVSDGVRFAYDVPRALALAKEGDRLVEFLKRPDGSNYDLKRIYAVSSLGLVDRSAILDIAISRTEDLQFLRNQWANLAIQGKEAIGGKEAYLVGGDWREYGNAPVSGAYQMAITGEGEILRFVLRETVAIGEVPNVPPQQITSTWVADLKLNAPVDTALFAVK